MLNKIQLPDDVVNCGYIQTKPFKYEQVFSSKSHNFKGTEREFIKKGYAYEYSDLDNHKRLVLN